MNGIIAMRWLTYEVKTVDDDAVVSDQARSNRATYCRGAGIVTGGWYVQYQGRMNHAQSVQTQSFIVSAHSISQDFVPLDDRKPNPSVERLSSCDILLNLSRQFTPAQNPAPRSRLTPEPSGSSAGLSRLLLQHHQHHSKTRLPVNNSHHNDSAIRHPRRTQS